MKRKPLVVLFIVVMRSIVVGLAYFIVRASRFNLILCGGLCGILAFDMIVAMPKFSLRLRHWRDLVLLLLPRISGTALSLAGGLSGRALWQPDQDRSAGLGGSRVHFGSFLQYCSQY